MLKPERLLMIAAVVLMGLSYVLPLWSIDIWAPQYPEGLGMTIWLSKITGSIDQINILNHYVGMKFITPQSIPELKFMPIVVAALMAIGVVAIIVNRRTMTAIWMGILVIAGILGLYDFWTWGYDYGHNLSPDAPIKVPGMSYQPPLIGNKTLLNIDASSWPHLGGIAIGLAGVCVGLALFWQPLNAWWRARRSGGAGSRAAMLLLMAVAGGVGFTGCTAKPEPIQVGVDTCEHCKMTISDARYGGELITTKGRIHKFDSISCLVRFYRGNRENMKQSLVSDYNTGALIDAQKAHFFRSEGMKTPMGDGTIAASDLETLKQLQAKSTGELLEWNAVVSLFM